MMHHKIIEGLAHFLHFRFLQEVKWVYLMSEQKLLVNTTDNSILKVDDDTKLPQKDICTNQ